MGLLLATVGVVAAQGPTGTYGSGIACSNLGTAPANLSLTFYAQDSSSVVLSYTDPTPVAIGASRNYFTPSSPAGLPSGYLGSAVVSSDQPMACNVNTQVVGSGVGTTANPARAGSSAGVGSADASTTLFASQVIKALSGNNSYLSIQNTENSPVTVYVNYADRFGVKYPAARETVSIPAQSNHVIYQGSNANLPSGFLGGASITATGKIVAMAAFYNSGASATTAQFQTYNPVPAGATKLYIPRFVRNYYYYNGGMSVLNTGATTSTVQIVFTFAGTPYTVNKDIPANSTYSPYAPNITELAAVDALPVGQRTGSAVITVLSGPAVTAIVNEDNRGTCNQATGCGALAQNQIGFGSSYNAIADGTQTNNVFLAQVPRNVSGSISGGFQLANISASAGTCNITYPAATAANETNVAIAGNGSLSRFAPNVTNLPNGFNSSVVVNCTVPVVGISNFSNRATTYFGDSYITANGVNQ